TKAFSHGEGVAVENRFTAGMYEGIGTYVNSEYVTEEEFSTQLGDVDLQTEDKTLKGAINEVFTTGNNVKRDTVDALLSVDDSLPVTSDSNWSDVIGAIGGISTGKKWASGKTVVDNDATFTVTGLDFDIGEFWVALSPNQEAGNLAAIGVWVDNTNTIRYPNVEQIFGYIHQRTGASTNPITYATLPPFETRGEFSIKIRKEFIGYE